MRSVLHTFIWPATIFTGLLCGALSIDTHAADSPEWIEVGRSEGVTVFRKEIPGDPVFAYRGQGVLEAPLGKILTVTCDVKRHHEWVNRLEEARVLREFNPSHRVLYMKVDTPWPLKDRDFVVDATLEVDAAKKTAVVSFTSIQDPSMPEQECCVRGEMHRNRVRLTGQGARTEVDAEAHVDPKGSVPKWIVNAVQKTFPGKSIRGLLKQVAKPEIVESPLAGCPKSG